MPPTPSLNVSLTPHLEQFIAASVASGRYQTASEVVRAGLRLLERFESGGLHSGASAGADPSGRTARGHGAAFAGSDGWSENPSATTRKDAERRSSAKAPRDV